jgi:hypothetical protein
MGWAPTNKIFIHKPTPKSNFCLLAPAQFSKHLEGWTLRTPGGWAHHKLNFTIQTHPEEQLLFAGPCPILYPSRFFRPGHYSGYPRGSTFGIAPWLGAEPRWNEEPTPNFRVVCCVGLAEGRRTYTHSLAWCCSIVRNDKTWYKQSLTVKQSAFISFKSRRILHFTHFP